jgi:signal transduction histidine kinase
VFQLVDFTSDSAAESPEVRLLFHRLNNQLGTILAHAELLEAKSRDDVNRARAAQVVTSVLEAMATTREIRDRARGEAAAPHLESEV